MTELEAAQALSILVGGTQGWNDEAVALYLTELVKLDQPQALIAACQQILTSHDTPGRPSLARILDVYKHENWKQQAVKPTQTQLERADRNIRIISPVEGINIARQAYEDECVRQGKPANGIIFDVWARKIGVQP
jgi:hypothetical protein